MYKYCTVYIMTNASSETLLGTMLGFASMIALYIVRKIILSNYCNRCKIASSCQNDLGTITIKIGNKVSPESDKSDINNYPNFKLENISIPHVDKYIKSTVNQIKNSSIEYEDIEEACNKAINSEKIIKEKCNNESINRDIFLASRVRPFLQDNNEKNIRYENTFFDRNQDRLSGNSKYNTSFKTENNENALFERRNPLISRENSEKNSLKMRGRNSAAEQSIKNNTFDYKNEFLYQNRVITRPRSNSQQYYSENLFGNDSMNDKLSKSDNEIDNIIKKQRASENTVIISRRQKNSEKNKKKISRRSNKITSFE